MAKKLTRAGQAAWEAIKYLVSQNKGYWNGYRALSGGVIRGEPKVSAPLRTLQGIERAGLIKLERAALYSESKEFTLTDAGKAEAQPATGTAQAAFGDVEFDTIFSIAPIALYEVELNTPGTVEELDRLRRENAKLLRSEDKYHQEVERYARALSKILSALMVAQPVNDLIDEIHSIVTEALAEPVE